MARPTSPIAKCGPPTNTSCGNSIAAGSWFGLAIALLAAWLLVWPRMGGPSMLGPLPMRRWAFGLMIVGWAILGTIIVKRTRFHMRRMSEPEA